MKLAYCHQPSIGDFLVILGIKGDRANWPYLQLLFRSTQIAVKVDI